MKLISYLHGGSSRWGCVVGDGVIDLGRRLPAFASVSALLAGGDAALAQARAAAEGAVADHALADVRFELPIARPRRVFCIGVNYAHRNAEYKDGSDLPKYPSIFMRDWVHHAKFNVTQGKNFNASGSIGPWIVTADEFPQGFGALRVSTRVNGEQRQDDTTENLMFDFAYLVHYLSTFTTLEPGDIIATGTPTGAGIRFDPPRFLKPGDVVEVEVSGVGVLRNVVRAEEAVQ